MISFNERQSLGVALPSGLGLRGSGAGNQWTWLTFIQGINQQDSNGNTIVPPVGPFSFTNLTWQAPVIVEIPPNSNATGSALANLVNVHTDSISGGFPDIAQVDISSDPFSNLGVPVVGNISFNITSVLGASDVQVFFFSSISGLITNWLHGGAIADPIGVYNEVINVPTGLPGETFSLLVTSSPGAGGPPSDITTTILFTP